MKKDLIERELAITMLEEHLHAIIRNAELSDHTKEIYELSRRHAIDVLRIVPPANADAVLGFLSEVKLTLDKLPTVIPEEEA